MVETTLSGVLCVNEARCTCVLSLHHTTASEMESRVDGISVFLLRTRSCIIYALQSQMWEKMVHKQQTIQSNLSAIREVTCLLERWTIGAC